MNPFSRLTARLFDSNAQKSALPAFQPSELAVVTPSASTSTWSSLFKTRSRNRTQGEKLEAASGSKRTTLFRCSAPQQQPVQRVKPKGRRTARKAKNEGTMKDEKKEREQLMSAEMRIQIAQLALGYA